MPRLPLLRCWRCLRRIVLSPSLLCLYTPLITIVHIEKLPTLSTSTQATQTGPEKSSGPRPRPRRQAGRGQRKVLTSSPVSTSNPLADSLNLEVDNAVDDEWEDGSAACSTPCDPTYTKLLCDVVLFVPRDMNWEREEAKECGKWFWETRRLVRAAKQLTLDCQRLK